MNIYELDDIIALKNWDKICEELEKQGLRKAGEVGNWEFDPKIIITESAYHKSAFQKDDPNDKEYRVTLYQDNDTYKGKTFVTLDLMLILRDYEDVPVPRRSLLFTDAPYNAEYIREMNSLCKCYKCGDEYLKKFLCEYEGNFLCTECFVKVYQKAHRISKIRKYFKRLIGREEKV